MQYFQKCNLSIVLILYFIYHGEALLLYCLTNIIDKYLSEKRKYITQKIDNIRQLKKLIVKENII